jgi:hypothetical protein
VRAVAALLLSAEPAWVSVRPNVWNRGTAAMYLFPDKIEKFYPTLQSCHFEWPDCGQKTENSDICNGSIITMPLYFSFSNTHKNRCSYQRYNERKDLTLFC